MKRRYLSATMLLVLLLSAGLYILVRSNRDLARAAPPPRPLSAWEGQPIQFSRPGIVTITGSGGGVHRAGSIGLQSPTTRELFSYDPESFSLKDGEMARVGFFDANTPLVFYWQIDGIGERFLSTDSSTETTMIWVARGWVGGWEPEAQFWWILWRYCDHDCDNVYDNWEIIDLVVWIPHLRLPFEQSAQPGRCGRTDLPDSVLYCINAFFDHDQPTGSSTGNGSLQRYFGEPVNPAECHLPDKRWFCYDEHAGYDFQLVHAGEGSLVLAARSGWVFDMSQPNVCDPQRGLYRGTALTLMHSAGYWTEYWHLSRTLVSEGDWVLPGTPIGVVGNTGCTSGATGIHLHFGVKNWGGPEGRYSTAEAVDPFGWSNSGPDPYEAKGHGWCLWEKGCPSGLATAAEGGAVRTESGDIQASAPAGAVTEDTILQLDVGPSPPAEPSAIPAGYSFSVSAEDVNGNPVESFLQPLTIVINYAESALDYVFENSLGVYAWDEVGGTWQPMSTALDLDNNTATVITDHLSMFALLGQPVHDPPYITSATPDNGYSHLDTTITISGQNFLDTPAVSVGPNALPVTFVNSTTLTAVVPSGLDAGTYDLTVSNPDTQDGTLESAFIVLEPLKVYLPLTLKNH